MPEDPERLRKAEHHLIEFLDAELKLAMTFLWIAETALAPPKSSGLHADRLIEKAQQALTTVEYFMGRIQTPESFQQLTAKRRQIEQAIRQNKRQRIEKRTPPGRIGAGSNR